MNDGRCIAIVTGSRAEFGLLEPVLRAMKKSRRLQPRLVVTGMHLLPKFGNTIDDIRRAGWRIDARVPMQTGRDNAAAEPLALSRGIAGLARAFNRMRADIVVVLGDRVEAFAGACAAAVGRRVLVHIHGGDRATGDVDDALRNAIARLAHVHLVASREAAERLRRMGEAAWRIHRVGAPGLDDILLFRQRERRSRSRTDAWLRQTLGPIAANRYAVVVQHPAGRRGDTEAAVMRNIAVAVDRCCLGGVVIHPNSDPGHQGIMRVINGLSRRDGWRSFASLPREDYLRLVSRAAVLVGNSSGGIIESASIGVNAVNVGPRQSGRLRCGPNVIDAGESAAAITRAIRTALRKPPPRFGHSVYGDGRAVPRIARILERLASSETLLHKQLTF